jgi:hypothetical protein
VRAHGKQALAYVYCENEPGRGSSAKLLTRDEAFLIAVYIAAAERQSSVHGSTSPVVRQAEQRARRNR